jgi:hypothetical protein
VPARSRCSTPFCKAQTTVRASHSLASHPAAASVWVSFTASNTTSTGPATSAGSVHTGSGTTIGAPSSGLSSLDARAVRPHTNTG